MNHLPIASLCTVGLFALTLSLLEVGRRMGRRRVSMLGRDSLNGVSALDGAVFGLLGLLLAFTFSGAAARFDARRQLIVAEANDIGTAYLRIDVLPASHQPAIRESFRKYLDSRIETYRKLPDIAAAKAELANNIRLQGEIWTQAVAAGRASDSPAATMLMLPALNAMIDVTTTRTMAAESHPPPVVFAMLLILVLASAFLAGHGMAVAEGRDWLHMICFAIVMSSAVYVILDFEFPRIGFVRVDDFDHALVELRASMK